MKYRIEKIKDEKIVDTVIVNNKKSLYIEFHKIQNNERKKDNHDWSVGFYMKTRDNFFYVCKNAPQYDRNEFERLMKK